MDINELEQIIAILKANEVTEFELEHGDTHIRLRRGDYPSVVSASHPQVVGEVRPAITPSSNGITPQAAATPVEDIGSLIKVESPIVGTFYRRPSPDAEPFVSEGTIVKKGDTLCIVEAMKLMNEIEAPSSGKITKVLLTDGEVVEYGEVLFLIDPAA